MSNGGTPAQSSAAPQHPTSILTGRTPDELTALRHLVQRCSLTEDGSQQPAATTAHILRTDHNLDITPDDVLTLLAGDTTC
jgi:hypothetical protein